MSHQASHWAILQLPESAHEKAVLMVLADFHNSETGRCDPSAITVAELCRCNERTARRCLESLQAQEFIWMEKRDRRPALIHFNWTRPGAYEFKKKTTDTVPADPKDAAAKPPWARPVEDDKTATDTVPASEKSADTDDTSAETLRTLTTPSADSDAQSAGTVSDEPKNQVLTRSADRHPPVRKTPDPVSASPPAREPMADPSNETPVDQLRHARRSLDRLQALATPPEGLVAYWQAEVTRLEAEIGAEAGARRASG